MAKSLNQAFIRAYSKVRAAEQPSDASEVVSPEDYIVRLDTTSVQVPAPHYLHAGSESSPAQSEPERAPVPANVEAAYAKPEHTAPHFAAAEPPVAAEYATQPTPTAASEANLREAIAKEMLQASDWDQSSVDSLMEGLPTIVSQSPSISKAAIRPVRRDFEPTMQAEYENRRDNSTIDEFTRENRAAGQESVADRVVATTERLQEMASAAESQTETSSGASHLHPSESSRQYDLQRARDAEFARVDSPARESMPDQDVGRQNPAVTPAQPAVAPPEAKSDGTKPSNATPNNATPDGENEASVGDTRVLGEASSTPKSTEPILEAPKSPALQQQEELRLDLQAAQPGLTPDEVRQIVEDYVAKHSRGDEIFRLDSPSYPHTDFAKSEDLQQSDEMESMEVENSVTETDIRGLAEDARKEIRELESHLREAATVAFHSGWEVDRLQWPDVCEELVRVREDKLNKLAHNLVGAVDEGLQVLAVTSPSGGEGRTTVACCLARMVATTGMRVALLDADIENPSLAPYTNIEIESDWKSAIVNQLPIEEVAIYSIEDQLTLLPLMHPVEEDEFSSDDNRIAFMLNELAESFDLVIVDSGHMDSTRTVLSSLAEQSLINAVLTVVDHRNSTPQRIEACIKRIRRSGVNSVGLVENFSA